MKSAKNSCGVFDFFAIVESRKTQEIRIRQSIHSRDQRTAAVWYLAIQRKSAEGESS